MGSEETLPLEELLPMLITNAASTLVSKSQEPTLRSCQDNGNIKSVHALVSRVVTTCGFPDIFSTDALKSSDSPSPSSQSSSQTGTDPDATPTSQPHNESWYRQNGLHRRHDEEIRKRTCQALETLWS